MTTLAPTTQTQAIPGYVAGTWDIDPVHSEVSFVVRHMVVSKVRGRFNQFGGTIVTAEDPLASSVEASIEAASIDTNQDQRDAHVRSADFLDVESHPTIAFTSTALRANGDDYVLDGDLTIRGVTKPVTVDFKLTGASAGHLPGRLRGQARDQPQGLGRALNRRARGGQQEGDAGVRRRRDPAVLTDGR